MSLRQLSVRLEIGFWQVVIQLLSESRFIQTVFTQIAAHLPGSLQLYQSTHRERLLRLALIGFALGFLMGLITALL